MMSQLLEDEPGRPRLQRNASSPDYELEPALPYVAPGVGNDVNAQVSAPCCQRAVQNAEHADHDNISPALVRVKQPENHSLGQNGDGKVAGRA